MLGAPAPEPERKWALLEGVLAEDGLDSCEARADAAAMEAAAARVQVSDAALHCCLSPKPIARECGHINIHTQSTQSWSR